MHLIVAALLRYNVALDRLQELAEKSRHYSGKGPDPEFWRQMDVVESLRRELAGIKQPPDMMAEEQEGVTCS